jgi:hypothetical protein
MAHIEENTVNVIHNRMQRTKNKESKERCGKYCNMASKQLCYNITCRHRNLFHDSERINFACGA